MWEWGFTGNAAKGKLEFALNREFTGLDLPAAEVGAIVSQGELPVSYPRGGMSEIGHQVPV